MDIALALDYLIPGAKYGGSLTKNSPEVFNELRWEDTRTKPSWEQLQEAWNILPKTSVAEAIEEILDSFTASEQLEYGSLSQLSIIVFHAPKLISSALKKSSNNLRQKKRIKKKSNFCSVF